MSKTYRLSVRHDFKITTDNIDEVRLNYMFPDFSECKSIQGEAEFLDGLDTWTEYVPNACNCDQCQCDSQDDYTEENGTCEDCFRDCLPTEGGE
jgi:hypothetical protein